MSNHLCHPLENRFGDNKQINMCTIAISVHNRASRFWVENEGPGFEWVWLKFVAFQFGLAPKNCQLLRIFFRPFKWLTAYTNPRKIPWFTLNINTHSSLLVPNFPQSLVSSSRKSPSNGSFRRGTPQDTSDPPGGAPEGHREAQQVPVIRPAVDGRNED